MKVAVSPGESAHPLNSFGVILSLNALVRLFACLTSLVLSPCPAISLKPFFSCQGNLVNDKDPNRKATLFPQKERDIALEYLHV
jgi:hypothetical protein